MSEALISAATPQSLQHGNASLQASTNAPSAHRPGLVCTCSNKFVQGQREHEPSCETVISHLLQHVACSRKALLRPTLCPVDNGGSTGSGDSVVVGLPEPSDSADACLGEEMHGKVAQALLSDHHIRLVLDDLGTDLLDVVFLQLQQCSPANGAHCWVPCSSTLP